MGFINRNTIHDIHSLLRSGEQHRGEDLVEHHLGGPVQHDPGDLRCEGLLFFFLSFKLTILLQVIAASVGRAFGPDYFAPNFGLFFTATIVLNIITITIVQVCWYNSLGRGLYFHLF